MVIKHNFKMQCPLKHRERRALIELVSDYLIFIQGVQIVKLVEYTIYLEATPTPPRELKGT